MHLFKSAVGRTFFLFFVALLLGSLHLNAQELLARGVIIDKANKNRVALAEISNKRTGYIVGSNDMGFFQLNALPGDTLVIMKKGYKSQTAVVADAKDIVIYIYADYTSIEEVLIKGQSKIGTLEEMRKDYKSKGSFYGGKPPILSFLLTPISAFYELFGKTPRNARRFGKYYASELQQTKIDGLFNAEVVSRNTGLSGKQLEDFMLNYRPDFNVAEKWTPYDAVNYIRDSFKKYADTAGRKP